MGERRSARLSTWVGAVLGLATSAFVVRALVADWSRVSTVLSGAEWPWLVLDLVLAAVGMATIAWVWRGVLHGLGEDAPVSRVLAWYFLGEAGKYLPGNPHYDR